MSWAMGMGSNCSNLNANAPMAQSQILCMPIAELAQFWGSEIGHLDVWWRGSYYYIGVGRDKHLALAKLYFFSFLLSYFQSADSHGG